MAITGMVHMGKVPIVRSYCSNKACPPGGSCESPRGVSSRLGTPVSAIALREEISMAGIRRRLVLGAVACLFIAPADVNVQSGDDARRPAGREWPAVSGDFGNTRHSTLRQVSTENVAKLGGAWNSGKFESGSGGTRTMPVVHDGLMFLTASPSVYALDARTGARVWRFQAGAQAGMGGPAREGVAVGDGLVFVGLSDARVIALREKTGELVWNKYVGDKARDKG
jgi:glucose dehydrogenase